MLDGLLLQSGIHSASDGINTLTRLFHAFPDGRTGLGLLLLRAAVGGVVLVEGGMNLVRESNPTVTTWEAGLLAVATGISLVAGFLTPIVAGLVAASAMGVWILMGFGLNPSLLASKPFVAFLAATAAAVVLLGPGAFSLDARLFGLREIIIPPRDFWRS